MPLAAILAVLLLGAAAQLTPRAPSPSPPGWPQWGGPDRNFTAGATGLTPRWPAAGPPVVWRRPLGEGHSSIVGDSRRLFTMYRNGEREIVVALDAATGRTAWEFGYDPVPYERLDASYGRGPHSTPLLHGGKVYAIGTTGRLSCLDQQRGTLIWSHELWRDFHGSFIVNGYASSPIAFRDTVIVQVGGRGRSLIAFEAATGRVRWQAHDFRNSQSSPILASVDGVTQLVAYMHDEIVGVDPGSGALLWRHPVAATMNFHFNMRVHHENAIRVGDTVYASTGHLGPAFLTAFDVRDGRVRWQDRGFSHAMLLRVGDRMLVLDEDGTLGLASVTPRGLTVHSRAEILRAPAWTPPTPIGSMLYVRDRHTIAAVRIR